MDIFAVQVALLLYKISPRIEHLPKELIPFLAKLFKYNKINKKIRVHSVKNCEDWLARKIDILTVYDRRVVVNCENCRRDVGGWL